MKSTLWALAFACAAVSCSDDFEEPNNGGEGNGANGETTYMKVTVNPGIVTRADNVNPDGGEEGDTPGGETGDPKEYQVNDVTVILYEPTGEAANPDYKFSSGSKIVAAGWAKTSGIMGDGDELDNVHSKSVTVQVTVNENNSGSFDGQTYGIITVANWGSDDLKTAVLGTTTPISATNLANYLSKKENTSGDFIMSSHRDAGETVKLVANATEANAPNANVHVERLAAKIRINPTDLAPNFIYTVGEVAKVRLDNVSVVNQLSSGSYLLKRVTPSQDATEKTIPALASDDWLADEEATTGENVDVQNGLNYVIDPWTRGKLAAKVSEAIATEVGEAGAIYPATPAVSLSYTNRFSKTATEEGKFEAYADYNALWEGIQTDVKELSRTTSLTDKLTLCYTMENTTSGDNSLNGYSTGAVFKATYLPKQWSATTNKQVDGQEKKVVEAVAVDYNGDDVDTGYDAIAKATTGKDFYVYGGNIYKDMEAIFNEYVWSVQEDLEGNTDNIKIFSYSDFSSSTIATVKMSDFKKNTLLYNSANDPFGYLATLKKAVEEAEKDGELTDTDLFTADNALDTYLTTTTNKDKVYAFVDFYDDGVCYYPYWIRHANNNNKTVMGIMEFGIVRNNIYDMTVTGISGLGLSGMAKPNPGDPDEKKEYRFNVRINVKNWVVRKNGDIIL